MTTQSIKATILDLLRERQLVEEAFVQDLSEAEKSADGTLEHWTARDYMAHLLFWHRNLFSKLTTLLQGQALSTDEEDEDQLNAATFADNRSRPFSAVYADLEHVDAELLTLIEHLSEEELTDTVRFAALTNGRALYTAFLGSFYEHDQEHFAQYYIERNNVERATRIREKCADNIMHTELPDWVKGSFLYNLACFYAKQKRLDQASTTLQEALKLAPNFTELSKNDPDLAALRD